MPSHWPVDAPSTDLAREFRANPWGPHRPDLQRLLNRMRWGPLAGKLVLTTRTPSREWVIARLPGRRGEPLRVHDERVFTDPAQAEWAVFKLRWEALTGRALDIDGEREGGSRT